MMEQIDETETPTPAQAHAQPATRDKAATRRRLLDAAEEVFAAKGYHAAGVEDIIQASESSKGGFYFHFPNKQAIFLALIDALVPKLAIAVDRAIADEPDPIAQLDAALRTVLETFGKHRRLSKILLVEAVGLGHGFDDKLMRTRGYFAGMIQGHLDRIVASGALPPFDTETVSWAWFGAINELVVRWLVMGRPERLEDVLPPLRALLLRSVGVTLPQEPATEVRP
ncbi:MAG TPA: TetR/AcrR family transcriptional regulator [Ktedonobacterales bacterium]|jgi:TetR/AcrR family transcriptional regulator, fatty acid metabolism regulator protein|nr:TetR/AcrR family transcriptional regulator [Ktedonobacterales bacterium]